MYQVAYTVRMRNFDKIRVDTPIIRKRRVLPGKD